MDAGLSRTLLASGPNLALLLLNNYIAGTILAFVKFILILCTSILKFYYSFIIYY